MPITADITGQGNPIHGARVVEARRCRRLGHPVFCSADISLEDRDRDVEALAELLESGEAFLEVRSTEAERFIPPQRVVGLESFVSGLEARRIRIQTSGPPLVSPPRRRVLHPATFADLVKEFADLAETPTLVANVLSRVKLPERTSIVQDGEDDGSFLLRVLAQHDAAQPERALHGLVTTGVFAAGGKPAWRLTWGHGAAFRHLNRLEGHGLEFAEGDGVSGVDFGTSAAGVTVVRKRLGRKPSTGAAGEWLRRELPVFWKKQERRLVGRVEDRLYETHAGTVAWDTACEVRPSPPPAPAPVGRPWVGPGVAEGWEDTWLRVRLPGFPAKGDGDVVYARLLTPTSGSSGEQGMHVVPEQGTTVLLAWTGLLTGPVVVLGNVRDKQVQLAEPSLWLERPTRFRFGELLVEVDETHRLKVGGDCSFDSDGEMALRSTRKMGFEGDGGTAALAGGSWKSGMGG